MNPAWLGKQIYVVFTEKTEPVEDRLSRDLILEMDETDGWFYSPVSENPEDEKIRFMVNPFMVQGYSMDMNGPGVQPWVEYDIQVLRHPMDKPELRGYFFQNFYLQGIHAGIQTAHTIANMCVDYLPTLGAGMYSADAIMLDEWARNHKTIVVYKGGMHGMQSDLEDMYAFLSSTENSYPFGKFHEEQAALNGALTNVGVILPDYIFKYKQWVKEKEEDGFGYVPTLTEWELELVERISKCRLMN